MTVAHVGLGRSIQLLDEHASRIWFGKLDPRAKLLGVLAFVVATALLTRTSLLLASLAIAIVFAASSRVPVGHLSRAYLTALPFILVASASVFVFGGAERGLNMWMRVSACTLALLTLATGTETFDLFSGLRRLKVPPVLTTLLMLTYRYMMLISGEYERMKIARRARGFTGGRNLLDRNGMRVLSYTAGMILVRSSARAERVYEGLKARGFREDMSMWKLSTIAVADAAFMVVFFAASVLLIALQNGVVI
jgi:cobalt/nickel transport system permease protein